MWSSQQLYLYVRQNKLLYYENFNDCKTATDKHTFDVIHSPISATHQAQSAE